jgi:transmembrane sensor
MNPASDSRPPRPSDDESIAATAAAWLAQRDDTFSQSDAADFARWREADPRHAAAVARLERAWTVLQPLRDFRPAALRHPDRDLLAAPTPVRAPAAFPARAFAFAAAALMLALGFWAFRTSSTATLRYATTAGGYERVMLADSSVLELNGDSAAEVTYTAAERRVRLTRGEAHFTVAKNPARPFRVEALGIAVRAVGTAFNVRLGTGEVEVLVTEGKVSVSKAVGPALAAAPLAASEPPRSPDTFLVAHERAVIAAAGSLGLSVGPLPAPVVERIAPEAVRTALIWQGPSLVFAATPLAEVAAQFNRRNPIQIILADNDLATLPIGGSFRPENVEAFVQLLESGNEILVDRSDATRLVLRSAK